MNKFLFLPVLLFSSTLFAQYDISINAFIFDSKTNKPIPYVNIGFVNKRIGTVSNEDGRFKLKYDEALIRDAEILQISSLGYETLSLTVSQLKKLLINTNKIFLKEKIESLNEVFLKFYVNDNQSDSLKIRVNIYDYKKRYPTEKILKTNLFYTVKVKSGEVSIDLEPYNIVVNKDFVVSIELIEVYGNIIEFALSGHQLSRPSFSRYVSQDKWDRRSDLGVNFSVLTSVPANKEYGEFLKRPIPNKITLYWDASFFRDRQHIATELKLLKSYLRKQKNTYVRVIAFNNGIAFTKAYSLTDNIVLDLLISDLKQIQYKGNVDYNLILKKSKSNPDAILLFTDGTSLFSELEPEVNAPIFVISSSSKANHIKLQKTAYYGDGHYINLQKATQKEALQFLTFEIPDKKDYALEEENSVSGTVSDLNGPIQNATVRVKNTLNEVQTNSEGYFKIVANQGDILTVNYLGMLSKEISLTEDKSIIVELQPDGEILSQIDLKGKAKTELIETGYGKRNKDGVGVSINTITSEEIGPQYNSLARLLVGRFAGVQVAGLDAGTPKYIIRGGGGSLTIAYAMFDIDGLIYDSEQIIPEINVQNIERITILKSIAATNKYGTLGRGGAIVIKTKSLQKAEARKLKIYKALSLERTHEDIPFYLDVSDYFIKWDKDFSVGLLERASTLAFNNVKALKVIAYKLEEKERFKEAKLLYKRIAVLKPKSIQTYRDLASIYTLSGDYNQAMKLYIQMLNNEIPNLDFSPITRG